MSGRGNFLARVVQYVVNELIVDRLANNPSFQRFAVRSSKAIEEMAQKGAQTKEELTQQLKVYSESFKEELFGIDTTETAATGCYWIYTKQFPVMGIFQIPREIYPSEIQAEVQRA